MLVNQNGTLNSSNYYYPYGSNRGGAQSTLTAKRYTGQYHEAGLAGSQGLYYYGARWYDPQLARFAQADTIVPSTTSSQGFNRYMYTFGNPLGYVDPSGHDPWWIQVGTHTDAFGNSKGAQYVAEHLNKSVYNRWSNARRIRSHEDRVFRGYVGFVGDWIPGVGDAKGFLEVFTGRDVVSGEKLGHWRWLGIFGMSE
ncbi:MAG: hypothetical protein GY753_15500, partial [Gammaproteobacteria bacterium]|nr:hypothetical protein [Gammaproteobacteria bacterium]